MHIHTAVAIAGQSEGTGSDVLCDDSILFEAVQNQN
jgi:hypothetical protein